MKKLRFLENDNLKVPLYVPTYGFTLFELQILQFSNIIGFYRSFAIFVDFIILFFCCFAVSNKP